MSDSKQHETFSRDTRRNTCIPACGFLGCQQAFPMARSLRPSRRMDRPLRAPATVKLLRKARRCTMIWTILFPLMTPLAAPAQPSTAPPSSLPTTPLSPGESALGRLPFCDLCRQPETRAGSDLRSHRVPRGKSFRPHKNPKGMHRPARRGLRSLLPHYAPERTGTRERALESGKVQAIDGDTIRYGAERIRIRGFNAPELTEPGGSAALGRLSQLLREGSIRIVPRGKDVYDRMIADLFVNGRNVAEVLVREGYSKPRD